MTRAIAFLGPTLTAEAARGRCPSLVVAPPVQCGDVYRAVQSGYRRILIVDGYFDHRLSVWHKEILWAMREGAEVWGTASMGAIRAAELAAFGMRGVGAVFAQYASGQIEDDDEVVVLHEDHTHGFRAISEAMINLRASFAAAVDSGVVDPSLARDALTVAKESFYAERTIERIARRATDDTRASQSLITWYRSGGLVDLKRADALAAMVCLSDQTARATPIDFEFPWTHYWDVFVRKQRALREVEQPAWSEASSADSSAERKLARLLVDYLEAHDPNGLESIWSAAAERACSKLLGARTADGEHELFIQHPTDEAIAIIELEIPNVFRELGTLDAVLQSLSATGDGSRSRGFNRE